MSMSDDSINHKVLIVSWSPVPTPKYQKIEGSGQRFYGLAQGLKSNGVRDITIAVGHIYPLDVDEVEGIKLFNYDFDEEFADRLKEYDTVIFNYAIHGSSFVASNVPDYAQVIIDAYGPAYIESLARNPDDMVGTYVGNLAAVNDIFNKVLPRGDYFLYANDAQEKFYTGVLATLGVINQFSYNTDILLRVSFGIDEPDHSQKYENPYLEYGVKPDDFVLLWFGGLYPWFDITNVLEVLKNNKEKNIKLVIVGGNNPQNQHPDFVKHYNNTVKYIEESGLSDRVILIDWVDYATRRKYYEHSDAIISINGHGKENTYSWRTRVMDYVGSTTPLITNGGDPLSDELIEVGAAFKIDDSSPANIHEVISNLASDSGLKKITEASERMKNIQPKYYWKTVTKVLASKISNQTKPYSEERAFRMEYGITDNSVYNGERAPKSSYLSARSISIAIRKVRQKGLLNSYTIVKDKARRRLSVEYRKRFPKTKTRDPRLTIVSNQLNNTGAPFVIMDVVKQIRKRIPKSELRIKVIAFTPVEAANVMHLEKMGVEVEVHVNRDIPIDIVKGDMVIMNSFAMSRTTVFSVMHAINQGLLEKVYWYGHEAAPDSFVDEDVKKPFTEYLNEGKAKIYAVSEKTKSEYVRFFETSNNIEKMQFRFQFKEEDFRVRDAGDFETLRFITTGSLMDMRKGQYPILYAFLEFYNNFYIKDEDLYRDFHLSFVGAYEKSDLDPRAPLHIQHILKQLKESAVGLEGHFTLKPSMPHHKALEEIAKSNITICYSLLEAMGIFVYEGMALGHPIIRNESAGQIEQLIEGKNGYGVFSDSQASLVEAIERLLNKQKTTNEDLVNMSRVSSSVAKDATKHQYQLVDEIYNRLDG